MTTREYFQAVLDAHISEELDTASADFIKKLDEKNEKRKNTLTKEQKEAAARREAVKAFFYSKPGVAYTRDEIAAALGFTPGQVTAAIRNIPDLVKSEVKVDKSRKVAYTLPTGDEEDTED